MCETFVCKNNLALFELLLRLRFSKQGLMNKHYVFECIKIESHPKKFPIKIFAEKNFQQIERTKLRQLEKAIYTNYYRMIGMTLGETDIPRPFNPPPYHPIELE